MATTNERLDAKTEVDPITGCWNWTGCLSHGYGLMSVRNRLQRVHRLSYERHRGPIPDGLTLDHLCRNRRCMNPAHLEPVTLVVNVMRGESPAAREARQTECRNGHPFSGDNLIRRSDGTRECRECTRARDRRHYHAGYRVKKLAAMRSRAAK